MAKEIQSEFIVRKYGRMYRGRGREGSEGTGGKGITRDRRVVLNMYSGPDCHFSLHCCYEAGGRGGGGGGGNSCCLLYVHTATISREHYQGCTVPEVEACAYIYTGWSGAHAVSQWEMCETNCIYTYVHR